MVIPKTDEQRARIEKSVEKSFLFRNLDPEQRKTVVDAMFEKQVPNGKNIIVQGDEGDYFYVVESGTFDVFVNSKNVFNYTEGGSFGELALMYNAPRAATVTATSDSIVWALDRIHFRSILMGAASQKRKMYEAFLEEVPVLSSAEPYERAKIADALESQTFEDGKAVVVQGDVGDKFYIIENGTAIVTQSDANGVVRQVGELHKGDYFGELALITDKPRQATVTAKGTLRVAALDKGAFDRLLGPCLHILKRNTENYEKYRGLEEEKA